METLLTSEFCGLPRPVPPHGFLGQTPPRPLPVLHPGRAAQHKEPQPLTDQSKSTFARRIRAARPREKRYEIRDDVTPGLRLRIFPSGARTFILSRMVRGRRRYATIGDANTMSVPEARNKARRLIAAFLDTVKTDGGPRTPGRPMGAFAAEFLDRQARHWKPRTLETNTYVVRTYILPGFGDIAGLWGYRPHNSNPCKSTKRYWMQPKERLLSPDEMARLNTVLTHDNSGARTSSPSSAC